MSTLGATLIIGTSSGIGTACADRLAKRGHDLVPVASRKQPLQELTARLTAQPL